MFVDFGSFGSFVIAGLWKRPSHVAERGITDKFTSSLSPMSLPKDRASSGLRLGIGAKSGCESFCVSRGTHPDGRGR